MTYIKLFFSLIYWGILARLYILAGNYRQWYQERSHTPLTVFGGGQEWPCKERIETLLAEVEDGVPC
jgi:hypothetical protein